MTYNKLVVDIEGTVCLISFVKDTLFPYFLEQIPLKLRELTYPINSNDEHSSPITSVVAGFPLDKTTSYETLLEHITLLVRQDIKDPTLKSLQGLVWQLGYDNGDLVAPVYQDAIDFIQRFNRVKENKVYVYSSGSIKAQKLLFGHVGGPEGSFDLNPEFEGYFDITTSGFKQETSSYENILKDIGELTPSNVLFLSDNVKEVQAAVSAGMQSYIVVRPGNYPLTQEDKSLGFKIIDNFEDL